MSSTPVANSNPPEHAVPTTNNSLPEDTSTTAAPPPKNRPPRRKGPNFNVIHSKPLPLEAYPLPAFHPTNPISLLRFAYAYLSQLLSPPSSHPAELYIGYFSAETRSVHVTDPKHARALWEMGFFGKGTLSRSEPSWIEREKARLKAKQAGSGGTAEEATNARREKRRLFKLERARAEAEKIEKQRLVEEGKLDPSVLELEREVEATPEAEPVVEATPRPLETTIPTPAAVPLPNGGIPNAENENDGEDEDEPIPEFENQEHLQLTLEEAFFLAYGLGVLRIQGSPSLATTTTTTIDTTCSNLELLSTFSAHRFFPPKPSVRHQIAPDDTFMLNYVVYHHFRSLGWVVRPGVKFSVDYLLYYRGPVFSHAEFAVIIMPTYTDPYWATAKGKAARQVNEEKDWWWLHCINRVQSQVLKTLVLCYVDIPKPTADDGGDIGGLLKRYTVREFILKRWLANRSRD